MCYLSLAYKIEVSEWFFVFKWQKAVFDGPPLVLVIYSNNNNFLANNLSNQTDKTDDSKLNETSSSNTSNTTSSSTANINKTAIGNSSQATVNQTPDIAKEKEESSVIKD